MCKTNVEFIPAKTIVTRTKNHAWFGTDYNMNLYRGCSHGCIYCDSRSNCYGITNFDQVCVKQDALRIIRDDLRRKVRTGVVGTGAMSDPYNPLEKELLLTRNALTLLEAYGFGAAIATKSTLIVRDIDVLRSIAQTAPVLCKVTITAADDNLSKKIEPHAPASSQRFSAVRSLSDAGLFTGVLMMPILPFLEDTCENIVGIIRQAKECGARFIYPAFGVTLRDKQREWYLQQLESIFPGENFAEQYRRRYGSTYMCRSPQARELWRLFVGECQKNGIVYDMKEIIRLSRMGYEMQQLRLY